MIVKVDDQRVAPICQAIIEIDTPKFSPKGVYKAKLYGSKWCVVFEPNFNPWGYSPPAIIAECKNESQASQLKRSLQNSLNHQARKLTS